MIYGFRLKKLNGEVKANLVRSLIDSKRVKIQQLPRIADEYRTFPAL